jgi:aspartyl-tRNA(Asn)/glutamyl-tRNA(Gln) amidotransferase subunit A
VSAPELRGASIATLSEGVRARRWRARDLVEGYLDRIARLDGQLGSFLRVDAAGARAAADAVDARIAAGQDAGVLAGVPVALKDIFATRGLETTAGSKILAGFVPPYDSTAGARLQAAGAVNLGKLNMDEFAMGSSSENSAFKPVRNPWAPACAPERWAPTPAVRSASRRRCVASPGSSRPTGASRATG